MSDMSNETELPRLISIEIEPGEISFDPDVTEYTIRVEEGTEKLLVRAKTEEGAQYTVGGTDLVSGRNEITVTVTGTDGLQNRYYLFVIVGEEEVSAAEGESFHASKEPSVQQTQTEMLAEADRISFLEHVTTGKNRYISIGICGCAAFALLLWVAFAVKRFRTRREQERQRQQKEQLRKEREERYQRARMQEEELLRQIELLKKKSRTAESETASGLRIIRLDEDEYAESEPDDSQTEDYDDYYDEDYEYSDDYDDDDEEYEDSDDN